MLPDIKRCERCYKPISWVDRADWYSHIRIKYCDECRPIVEREKTAARLKRFRERQKEAAKVRDQKLKDLELENLVLREKLKAMWENESPKLEAFQDLRAVWDNESRKEETNADSDNRAGDI